MHDCIFKLLRAGDEESLESTCVLFFTIGKDLDSDKAKVNLFNQRNEPRMVTISGRNTKQTYSETYTKFTNFERLYFPHCTAFSNILCNFYYNWTMINSFSPHI